MIPIDPRAWAWVGNEIPPRVYDPIWVAPGSYLTPMTSGAALRWIFDEDQEGEHSLVVRLTEDEAQRVFESESTTGMLESVRGDLRWRGALVFITSEFGLTVRGWRYFIQPDGTEEEFIADLMEPPRHVYENAARRPAPLLKQDVEFAKSQLSGARAS